MEDEVIIREGIKKMVPWEQEGFLFVGEASDGELALPLIKKLKPDVLITDIKMPFMDGLTLSRLVKKELPEMKIIILSGYDDFQYAREAIGIGINEYLLKPISKDSIIQTLKELYIKMGEEDQKKALYDRMVEERMKYEEYEKREFFEKAVSGNYSVKEILGHASNLGIDIYAQSYVVAILTLAKIAENAKDQFTHKLKQQFERELGQKDVLIVERSKYSLAFLIKSEADLIEKTTNRIASKIKEKCIDDTNLSDWSLLLGEPVNRVSAWKESYESALKKEEQERGLSKTQEVNLNELDLSKIKQIDLEHFLREGLPEQVEEFVEEYFRTFGTEHMESVLLRQYVVLNIRITTYTFLESIGKRKEAEGREGGDTDTFTESIHTVDAAKVYTKNLLKEAIALRSSVVNQKYTNSIDKVVRYIDSNFAKEDLSLNEVARIANVTPTHFSTIFSKEMGVTFVEYLTSLRMRRAKELLRSTSLPSMEIAYQVGYKDPHYFSAIFKKTQGCSPRNFRSGKEPL